MKQKRLNFKGISLEQKWKDRNEKMDYAGNKEGGKFMKTTIDYRGQNKDYSK